MDAKVCQVYDSKNFTKLLEGLKISEFMKLKQTQASTDVCGASDDSPIALCDLNIADTLYCSFCCVGFTDKQAQRQHYKLDWHRYNLKMHLQQRKPISEERFAQLADDVSSISGSDTETDDEANESKGNQPQDDSHLSHLISRRSRILFNNASGNVISLNRCLLLNKKEEPESYDYLVDVVKALPNKSTWLLIMIGGGHFAAAIFKDGESLLHKTFHSYTVRAKQGGAQSAKDGKTHAKSAGASMRRFNEQSLSNHVQDLLKNWGPDIIKCDYIFYRAVGRSNSGILFGGANPPLLRSDPRIRTVPFTTRRPTFNELKRVYNLIATVFVYDSNEIFKTTFSPVKPIKEKEVKEEFKKPPTPKKIDRAKERPPVDRKLPQIVQDLADETSTDDTCSIEFETVNHEISFAQELEQFADSINDAIKQSNNRKNKAKRKKKQPQTVTEELEPEVAQFWDSVHGSCENHDIDTLQAVLESYSESVTKEQMYNVLNHRNIEGQTILHKIASQSIDQAVKLLMLHGCDPSIKDKRTQTPYDVCTEKSTRNVFRRFMGEFPTMYDYSKSHIPSPLNDEIEAEISEKKKQQRKLKRQKEKEKKQQQEQAKLEEDDKKRFLALSDREKRALAAERRLIASSGKTSVLTSRCFLCAIDITGKVPFEYNSNRFCSIGCLKTHRTKS